jgi:uncharacterized protein (UPF0218 family)
MYRVIKFFTDLQDNNHAYHVGDIFPHDGMEVSEKRLLELSTDKNRRQMPLIEKVEDEKPVEDFMNPPEEPTEEVTEIPEAKDAPKPKKKRGRPRNDAE